MERIGYDDLDRLTVEEVRSPMLAAMWDRQVFKTYRLNDGRFVLEEACDGCFRVAVTADELRALAAELVELAGK